MANVLTDLAADIYKAADIVGRELVGVIPSMTINAGSEGAAFGDTVRAAVTQEPTLNDHDHRQGCKHPNPLDWRRHQARQQRRWI